MKGAISKDRPVSRPRQPFSLRVAAAAPLLLFAALLGAFSVLSPQFLTTDNLTNILVQASSTAIVATGMTFVLLTAGVDLSVGAIMFVAAAVAGKMTVHGASLTMALLAMLAVGIAFGALNAYFITRQKILPFIVTLATLYVGRGFALWMTETRAINLPESFLHLGSARTLGVPAPLWLLAGVIVLAQATLSFTPFGRQLYAVGVDREIARKAGVRVDALLTTVYVISGACAALGAIVSLTQLGAVSPTFGQNREFTAIAAAVLGGTSLFGGRGNVFPGTLLGAVLMQTVENGLVILNADPYLYPLVTSAIIFLAVLLDSLRSGALKKALRRRIRIAGNPKLP
ncbi:MAG: ABC transporter permease [Chthoniobacteraceae bacterium]